MLTIINNVAQKPKECDHFVQTGCAGEVIRLSEWYEVDDYKKPTKVLYWQLCISFYNNMFSGKTCWNQRFKHIWRIIKTGSPWKDEVVLDLDNAKILRSRLTEMISRAEKTIAP